MTIRTLIGRIVCAWRERMGRKPVHKWGRAWTYYADKDEYPHIDIRRMKDCTRCGLVVPVKTRKRRGAV